jgi:hypothetical protein
MRYECLQDSRLWFVKTAIAKSINVINISENRPCVVHSASSA